MMKPLLPAIAMILSLVPVLADAMQTRQVGRYVSEAMTASLIQLNPLSEVVSFSPDSENVGGAVRELLADTGYSLYTKTLLPGFDHMPLPRVHRQFTDMQVIEILHALAGPGYQIIIVEPLRQITFCFGDVCRDTQVQHEGQADGE